MAERYAEGESSSHVGNHANSVDKIKLKGLTVDVEADLRHGNHRVIADNLARKLSARQVQMIAIGKQTPFLSTDGS